MVAFVSSPRQHGGHSEQQHHSEQQQRINRATSIVLKPFEQKGILRLVFLGDFGILQVKRF
jgi:hypothetical protein